MTALALALALAPAHAARVDIASVTSKSDYNQAGTNYPVSSIHDGKSQTAWFEGESGNGLGAWVEVDLGGSKDVGQIVVYAGNWQSTAEWERANRPKELKITYADGATESWTLTDELAPQVFFPSGGKKNTSTIRFEIKQVFNGSAFPDTGISEIVVFDTSAPQVKSASASTFFPKDDSGVYMPSLAADGLRDTFWCESNKQSDGTGEWLELQLAGTQSVKGLNVCSGMCVSMPVHKKGNAVTTARVQFSDGSTETLEIKPFMFPKDYAFARPHNTSSLRIEVAGIKKGTDYDDACLSEVLPY